MELEKLKHVLQVNRHWIHYDDSTCEKATAEKLREVMEFAAAEERFYNRLSEEMREMSEQTKSKIDKMPVHMQPIQERSIMEQIRKEQDNERYNEVCTGWRTMLDIWNEALNKITKYNRIKVNAKNALEETE